MRKVPILGGVLLAAAAAGAVAWHLHRSAPADRSGAGSAPPAAGVQADRTAPPFDLRDVDGNLVSSSRFAGKPLAINFFATWCPPCRMEIPGFVEVYDKYKERGFELVGISLDTDTRGNLPGFIAQNRIGYRILFGDLATSRAFGGVSSIPTTYFVGRDGRIRKIHVGYLGKDDFEREVQSLL